MPLLRRTSPTSSNSAPAYDGPAASERPPAFTDFPSNYRVGSQQVLVIQVDQVKAHLKLLAAFHQLQKDVEAVSDGWTAHLEPKARWAVFVHIAVHRLELFLDTCTAGATTEWILPPLDVCLVLHSYMLNPGRYEEDLIRMKDGDKLRLLKQGFLTQAAKAIDRGAYAKDYDGKTASNWFSATKTIFEPLRNFGTESKATFVSPKGGAKVSVNWIEANGTGFAQQGFKAVSSPGESWTHEKLGIAKLYKDVYDSSTYLAGTVVSANEVPATPNESKRAVFVRSQVTVVKKAQAATSAHKLGSKLGWKKSDAEAFLSKALGPKNKHAVSNILAHYTRGERFSLDLAMAVLRQGTFIDKMHGLGWLEPGRFDEDDTILKRCVARYHAFLDLLSSTPSMFCVPTLDIDLGWHTHQLTDFYAGEMQLHVGRFIDHDDKVEENALATAFDVTARAWQSRFGVPYSTCGCPPPPQPLTTRLGSKLGLHSSPTAPYVSGALVPHSAALEDADATHASEHNALVLPAHPDAQKKREARLKEYEARRKRQDKELERAARKGKGVEKEDAEAARMRRDAHDAAFFSSYPVMPVYGPIGYPIPVAGCCSYEANHAGSHNGGSCATGTAGACASSSNTSAPCGSSTTAACASSSGGYTYDAGSTSYSHSSAHAHSSCAGGHSYSAGHSSCGGGGHSSCGGGGSSCGGGGGGGGSSCGGGSC
ncbi:hypothetical protein JCM10207_005592 [Rhodosporidiobolus poonsookiae]